MYGRTSRVGGATWLLVAHARSASPPLRQRAFERGRAGRMPKVASPYAHLGTKQLNAFVELADAQSFTRAAARCHLSQPAFSALIRGLEETLGVRLFDRDTRKVELTPEGRLFLDSARRLLADVGYAIEDLRGHVERRRGRVSIAVLPALAAGWLPDVLAGFHAQYPGIALDVADALSENCVNLVRAGRADFALASTQVTGPDLLTELFCVDRFQLVCRHDHPLARARKPRLDQLAGQPFIHLARNSSVRQHVEQAIFPAQMHQVMELEQLATVAGMVRAGLGITVVPALTLFHFQHPDLVTRPLDAPDLVRQIFVVRRRDRSLSAAARALLEWVQAHRPRAMAGTRRRRGHDL
jgi:LysR family transcriptional regulator, carnitine catabolism transcriptional activator